MFRRILVMCVVVALCQAASVRASSTFTFDPDGTDSAVAIDDFVGFDWKPGNALADGGNLAVANFIATADSVDAGPFTIYTANDNTIQDPFTLYAQAGVNDSGGGSLETLSGSVSPVGGTEFTLVAAFQEVVELVVVNNVTGTAEATFALAPGGTNFLEIWYDNISYGEETADAMTATAFDDLAGTGFNDGRLILSATVTGLTSSDFTAQTTAPTVPLDGFGADDYGIPTVQGGGNSNITASVSFADPDFFQVVPPEFLSLTMFDTTQAVPFDSVDPSAMFVKGAGGAAPVVDGAGAGAASLGAVNGAFAGTIGGPDVQFEADANQSFTTEVIPEPGSLAIWLLLGTGAVARGRRRRRKA